MADRSRADRVAVLGLAAGLLDLAPLLAAETLSDQHLSDLAPPAGHPWNPAEEISVDPLAALASLAIPALVVVTVNYVIACAAAPWGRCRKCHGIGRKITHGGRVTRTWCRSCDGTGRRVRVGRRLWTWLNREYRDGNR